MYLSIDLDYWTKGTADHCKTFFDQVFSLGKPIMVVMQHHHMFLDIDTSECTELWNVDWHSDLCEEPNYEFNEGTWGAAISWRDRGTFVWRYPRQECMSSGTCHSADDPFEDPRVTRWRRVVKKQGIDKIPWAKVERVGVCLSPAWVGPLSVIEYPLRKLRALTAMKRGQNAFDAFDDVRFYPPKVVRV